MQQSHIIHSDFNDGEDNLFFHDVTDLLNKILESLDPINIDFNFFNHTDSTLIQTIEGLDIFLQSVNHLISKCFKSSTPLWSKNLPIKELQVHLLSVIKAVLNAQRSDDKIMLADLLGHELKDNLTQWKIQILPSLRKEMKKIF